jgi:hypothetical protein
MALAGEMMEQPKANESKAEPSLEGLGPFSAFERLRARTARALWEESESNWSWPLKKAIMARDGLSMRRLALGGRLAQGVSYSKNKEETPLMALAGSLEPFALAALGMLLDAGAADPMWRERAPGGRLRSPLTHALQKGNFDGALALMSKMKALPSLDDDEMRPVAAATQGFCSRLTQDGRGVEGSLELIFSRTLDALERLGADVNHRMKLDMLCVRSRAGATALSWAVGSDHAVEELLRRGADPNIVDDEGRSPLMFAASEARCRGGSVSVMKLLLRAGADPLALDHEGLDALGWFAARQREGVRATFSHHMVGDMDERGALEVVGLLTMAGLAPNAKARLNRAQWVGRRQGRERPAWMEAVVAAEERVALGLEVELLERSKEREDSPRVAAPRSARL